MALIIKDAVKHALKARIGLLAPTGGGKTFTGLKFLFAMVELGMAKKVGVIDTEHRSASKYRGDFGSFRVVELEDDFSPEVYVEAIKLMAEDGVDALLIDSLTHAWAGKGGALELKDKIAKQRGYNDYTAWGPVGAIHIRLIEAMLSYPGHLIATMRLKMEYVLEEDPKTQKKVVRKIGLQPVQRDGMEYEFDIVGDLDQEHNFAISKTRCRALDGYNERKPGKDVIVKLRAWLEGGTAEADRSVKSPASPAPAPAQPDGASAAAAAPVAGEEVKVVAPHMSTAPGNHAPPVNNSHVAPGCEPFSFATQIAGAKNEAELQVVGAAIAQAVKQGKVSSAQRSELLAAYEKREAQLASGAAA